MEINDLFLCAEALPPLHLDSSSTTSASPTPHSSSLSLLSAAWESSLSSISVTPRFHPSGSFHNIPDFDSVLSSVSSLSSTTATPSSRPRQPVNNACDTESFVIGQLLGKLGCEVLIPPWSSQSHHTLKLSPDPGFAERAAKFSRFGNRSFDGRNLAAGLNAAPVRVSAGVPSGDSPESKNGYTLPPSSCREEASKSQDGSSISEQTPRKRTRGRAKEPAKGDDSGSSTKRCRKDDGRGKGDEDGSVQHPKQGNEGSGKEDDGGKKEQKKAVEPPKDYIHVRARRGQATDSHSLAERVRREKISERMKILQDLVPNCSKVTGKALMLDEIINYVQSLQRQVEFLSMKLASVNTSIDYRVDTLMSKDMFQSSNNTTTQHPMFELDSSAPVLYSQKKPSIHDNMQEGPNGQYSLLHDTRIPPLNGLNDQILTPLCGEDLHSIVQMGLAQSVQTSGETLYNPRVLGGMTHMKIELQ